MSILKNKVKDASKLQPGDHLIVSHLLYNDHCIVYSIPNNIVSNEEAYDLVQVVALEKDGVRLISLYEFCYFGEESPKYVLYGVDPLLHKICSPDIWNLCYVEEAHDREVILNRCDLLLKHFSPEKCKEYNNMSKNLDPSQFVLWCTLSKLSLTLSPFQQQLLKKFGKLMKKQTNKLGKKLGKAILHIPEHKLGIKEYVQIGKDSKELVKHTVDIIKNHGHLKDVYKGVVDGVKGIINHAQSSASSAAGSTTATAAGDTAKVVLTSGAKAGAAATMIGLSVGYEAVVNTGRIIRYKNDITYTKEDLKLDIAKSTTTTAVVLGVTVGLTLASNPVGWCILVGGLVGALCALCWWLYEKKYGKSAKQKMYMEFADKNEFKNKKDFQNIDKLNNLYRKLNQYIIKYKLHPDIWDEEEMKKKEEWLNHKSWYVRWWRKFQNNVSCTFKSKEELIASYKTKEEKLKIYALFDSIKVLIKKDIKDIKNGTYNDGKKKSKKNQQPLNLEYGNDQ